MFNLAGAFNRDISTKTVTNTNGTYTAWDVSNVTDMERMLNGSISFNQDLSSWTVTQVTECVEFNDGTSTTWTEPKPNFTNCSITI
jgi:hypothetical protein